jgi:nitrous oxide reductase accessory protein NosL
MNPKLLVVLAAFLIPPAVHGDTVRDDVKRAPACKYCGMDRDKFASSRMVIEYDDGTSVGLCSLHCAAIELANAIDKTPRAIRVADQVTRELVDAEKAVWVVGGAKPGVMTKRAKWAFADRARADAFIGEHGGAVATFDEAMKGAYEDMYQDTKMIREKRRAMRGGKSAGASSPGPEQPRRVTGTGG